jgi:uncharacterized membrane protein
MKNYITATFDDRSMADRVLDQLSSDGFTSDRISVISREDVIQGGVKIEDEDKGSNIGKTATVGGVIGGVVGLLAGIGAITIPGIGPLLIAGPLASALGIGLSTTAAATASGALTGAVAGGLFGALKEFGFDEAKARNIENKVKEGSILLMVEAETDEHEDAITEVFEQHGGENITTVSYTGKV